ncbi:AH receptor-interacting protein-like isoform X2 [Arctopsyche grandis]|uniref:AH receptor-interacting protein-like isoform X1 n=1 Tax=Arctopsyche grandis TaxID=121162 RepID=UPI00406D74EB
MNPDIDNCLIKKKILHPGSSFKPLKDGCKVHFHFQTRKTDADNTLIDDSRQIGKKEPMVLVLGKKFKLETWELLVKKMAINEVAKFTVDKSLVVEYPFISKTMRDLDKDVSERRTHFCAVTLQNEGIGYKDLNALIAKPCDLEFIIELLKVEFPEDYCKDSWQLSDDEKLTAIPVLKEKGNNLFKDKLYSEAADAYSEAICFCEQLMLKEKPHDVDWKNINNLKLPLLLNYSQCKLAQGDFYAVIEHCTTVLETEPDNVKALYKRAKAHMGAWSPAAAIKDFQRLKELDSSLNTAINKSLKELEAMQKEQDDKDRVKLKNMFT